MQIKEELYSWLKTIVLAALLALFITQVLIITAKVPSGSMENTIMTGDRVIALRTSYWFSSPQAGDIVIFRYPDDPTGETLYVKRVIGTPGDVVEMKDGVTYVNGETLDEPYLNEPAIGDYGPYEVPEGCYFMMGDNRNWSEDSRFWENKFVEENDILGKVKLRYYNGFRLY